MTVIRWLTPARTLAKCRSNSLKVTPKGVSDQVKRTYWARQDAQKTADEDLEGRFRYYNATIPERQDSNGVTRVQREVIIPIVE